MGRKGSDPESKLEELLDMAKVTSKGQVVIPQEARKAFGISTGDRVLFIKKGNELVIRKAQLVTAKPP